MIFTPFPKMARLTRRCWITEKLDGTNASICIGEAGEFLVGSRTRWITPDDDNFGFAAWAYAHKDQLLQLGPGHHFGEWWGLGIQRGYGQKTKRWSLFNVDRWCLHDQVPAQREAQNPTAVKYQEVLPSCCGLVPVLYNGNFSTFQADCELEKLEYSGSVAAPGYMLPEGVVVFHAAANIGLKKTIARDNEHKNQTMQQVPG